jgi:hypothetical protein
MSDEKTFVDIRDLTVTFTGGRKPVQGIDFGTLPDGFLLLSAIAGTFGHGSGLA